MISDVRTIPGRKINPTVEINCAAGSVGTTIEAATTKRAVVVPTPGFRRVRSGCADGAEITA
jgi:hypothetical protein